MQLPRRWPDTITAGGRTREVSLHLKVTNRTAVTPSRVVYALENWVIRATHLDPVTRLESVLHFAPVPPLRGILRIAVSIDDEKIVTAFIDQEATIRWKRGDLDYFYDIYYDVEVRL